MNLETIESLYNTGNKEVVATMKGGEKQTLRLFISTMGDLCYFAKGKRRRGYQITNILNNIETVKTKTKVETGRFDQYLSDLRKFKKAYTESLHNNLWADLRDGYTRLNVDEFQSFVEQGDCDKNDRYELYEKLCEYCQINNLYLNKENRYKTTTIKSNPPKNKWQSDYYSYLHCVENIGRHLENKEEFHYSWESNYDVSVSGRLCEDGVYRAWFSLEFRGCGNGHYYLLINENQAVFAEDD